MESLDNLPEERWWETLFENIIVIFYRECIVSEKLAKYENPFFTSLTMQKL